VRFRQHNRPGCPSRRTRFPVNLALRFEEQAAPPVSNWSGFYIGGNLGYGWGNGNTDFSFLLPLANGLNSLGVRSTGVIGGAQAGYNWQMGSLVTGLEADIQGSGIKGSASAVPTLSTGQVAVGNLMSSEPKLSWFGTVRGRLGVTVTPELLLYGTGGLAYGHLNASANYSQPDDVSTRNDVAPASISKTKVGWTAGAGAEWMFAHDWSAKLEYLYLDLGSDSAIGNFGPADPVNIRYTWHTQENITRVGVNYHFN